MNPRARGRQRQTEASLLYRASSRIGKATQRNLSQKKKNKNKNKKRERKEEKKAFLPASADRGAHSLPQEGSSWGASEFLLWDPW